MKAGGLVEEYVVLPNGSLRVRGKTRIGTKTVVADKFYRRSGLSKEAFLQGSKAKNGSMGEVLKRQSEEERKRW
jgi:hypothetical protein